MATYYLLFSYDLKTDALPESEKQAKKEAGRAMLLEALLKNPVQAVICDCTGFADTAYEFELPNISKFSAEKIRVKIIDWLRELQREILTDPKSESVRLTWILTDVYEHESQTSD